MPSDSRDSGSCYRKAVSSLQNPSPEPFGQEKDFA